MGYSADNLVRRECGLSTCEDERVETKEGEETKRRGERQGRQAEQSRRKKSKKVKLLLTKGKYLSAIKCQTGERERRKDDEEEGDEEKTRRSDDILGRRGNGAVL